MLKASVKLARKSAKVDWYLRDLYVKTIDNILSSGREEDVIDFMNFFIRKIRQDTDAYLFEKKVESWLMRNGFLVFKVSALNGRNLGDFVALRSGRIFLIEVKDSNPPWIINNLKEYDIYEYLWRNHEINIVYVWRNWEQKKPRIYATTFNNIELQENQVIVTKKYLLKELLGGYVG